MLTGQEMTRIAEEGPLLYHQDDILRGLRASLIAVLSAALAGGNADFDFMRGVFTIVRTQAALCGIPWYDLISSLRDTPELLSLIGRLQDGAVARPGRDAEAVAPSSRIAGRSSPG
jgi:hypothetical protein